MGLASNLPGPQELRSELQATLQVGAAWGKEGALCLDPDLARAPGTAQPAWWLQLLCLPFVLWMRSQSMGSERLGVGRERVKTHVPRWVVPGGFGGCLFSSVRPQDPAGGLRLAQLGA